MKPTVHQCLESMLFDGLKAVETAVAAYKTAQIDFFQKSQRQCIYRSVAD